MPTLFGTDGIRGTAGQHPLSPEMILRLGLSAGAVLSKERKNITLAVGRDTRVSGPMIQQAVTAGLVACGVDVIDLGIMTTPGVSFLVNRLGLDGGLVISASHNPVEQNGIKFLDRKGRKISEETENAIEALLLDEGYTFSPAKRMGRVTQGSNLAEIYIHHLVKEFQQVDLSQFRLVVDCANGASSYIAPDTFSRLGANPVTINASPNGCNINVNAGSEHVRRGTADITALINKSCADFGVAFDGDADRVIFIDQQGTLIDGDHVLGILAGYLKDQDRLLGNTVVTTVMRNAGLKHYVETNGLKLDETPVGDKYVSEKLFNMAQVTSNPAEIGLGGEQSGHILLLDDLHQTGDGLRTALFLVKVMSETHLPLEELSRRVGKTPQIVASAFVGKGSRIGKPELAQMEQQILKAEPKLIRINLRYSGTEPLFRAMLEAETSMSMSDLARLANDICRKAQGEAGTIGQEVDILNVTSGGTIQVGK